MDTRFQQATQMSHFGNMVEGVVYAIFAFATLFVMAKVLLSSSIGIAQDLGGAILVGLFIAVFFIVLPILSKKR